jgi:hypothetical protein
MKERMARQNNDFETVMGRQVARELKALRAPDEPSLQIEMLKLLDQHFRVRAGKINRQYDREIVMAKKAITRAFWR